MSVTALFLLPTAGTVLRTCHGTCTMSGICFFSCRDYRESLMESSLGTPQRAMITARYAVLN